MKVRKIYCVYNDYQTVEDLYCEDISSKPISHEMCNEHSCLKWSVGNWGPCSKPCHQSIRNRTVACFHKDSRVDPIKCTQSGLEMPIEYERCVYEQCPVWKTSSWSSCSANCGFGIQTRLVYCVNEKTSSININNNMMNKLRYHYLDQSNVNQRLDDSECDSNSKPTNVTECSTSKQCPEWRTKPWSACSVSCGIGVRMRLVYCSTNKSEDCSQDTKPANNEICVQSSCEYNWKAENWSEVIYFFTNIMKSA